MLWKQGLLAFLKIKYFCIITTVKKFEKQQFFLNYIFFDCLFFNYQLLKLDKVDCMTKLFCLTPSYYCFSLKTILVYKFSVPAWHGRSATVYKNVSGVGVGYQFRGCHRYMTTLQNYEDFLRDWSQTIVNEKTLVRH